jgi:hypothetical protein
MDDALRRAVELFNAARFTEFQDSLEGIAARTRAASELHFYTLLGHLAEGLHQIGNAKFESAEATLGPAIRKLENYVPRFRGLNIEALREDFLLVMNALREARAGGRTELHLPRLPRLRVLPE